MPPAARISDMHVCPMVTGIVPHVGGPVSIGCPTVMIGFMPAARVGDMCTCVGPPDLIAMGSPTVMIGGMMAARMGDPTIHGGSIVMGCPTVMIGVPGAGSPGGAAGGGAAPSAESNSVGEAGFAEGMIPVWGSGRDAVNAFQKGEIGWGLLHTALAASDIVLAGGLIKNAIKGGVKAAGKQVAKDAAKEAAEEAAQKAAKETAEKAAKETGEKTATNAAKPKVHDGKQGKHVPGHNNFQPGKSELTHPNPQALLDKGAGKGVQHGNKEVVDFGEEIGIHVGKDGTRSATTRGTIHYDAKGGAHIVPAKPGP